MRDKIGSRLIRIGAMTRAEVNDVLARQREGDSRCFGELAIALGYINDEAVRSYLKLMKGCPYMGDCHFYNIKGMTPHNKNLKEIYCQEWPEKCAIYQHKRIGKPIAITLWPSGRLQGV
jgi:hypothetical protein